MENLFNKKKPHWMTMDEAYENEQFLLKYFPKHYNKVEYQMNGIRNRRVYAKTRCVKVIKKFFIQDYHQDNQRSRIIEIIKSSRKSIEKTNFMDSEIHYYLPMISKYRLDVQKLDSWHILSRSLNIEDLTLEFCGAHLLRINEAKRRIIEKKLKWTFWRILLKLRKLNKFSLLITNDFSSLISDFFQKLNQLNLFLQNLDDLSLTLNCIRLKPSLTNFEFLNIFRNTRNLKVMELNNSLFDSVLQIQHFVNLKSLTLIKTTFLPEEQELSPDFGPFKYLQALDELQNLELSLHLSAPNSFKSFVESFSLPPSIKSISLSFHEISWDDLDFDKDILMRFHKQWENLDQLKSLSLCFTEVENVSNPSLQFIAPLFQKLSNLEKIYYANIFNNESGKKRALDLNYFLESLSHLGNTLKSLIIEAHAISIRKVSLDLLKKFCFDDLAICGFVLGDTNLINLFKALSKRSKRKQIFELETLVIDSNESFSQFLQDALLIPKRIHSSLSVDVRKVGSEFFAIKVSEMLRKLNRKNLSLTFRSAPDLTPILFDSLCKSLNNIDTIKYINIFDRTGSEIYNNENLFNDSCLSYLTDEQQQQLKSGEGSSNHSKLEFIDRVEDEESFENDDDDEDDEEDYFDMEDIFDDGFDDIIDDLEY